jgi:hypothetical protein
MFSLRLGLWNRYSASENHPLKVSEQKRLSDAEAWMSISQYSRKIGYAYWSIRKIETGYEAREEMKLSLNTMGMTQTLKLDSRSQLNQDFSLADFKFKLSSGLLDFSASGRVEGDRLTITTHTGDSHRTSAIAVQEKIYITPGIKAVFAATGLTPGSERSFRIFDPTTMGSGNLIVRAEGSENIVISGEHYQAVKLAFRFKGATQHAWVSESGEILREKGLLGITMEKTTRDQALAAIPSGQGPDLTRLASIPSDVRLDATREINLLRIRLDLANQPAASLFLDGGRQSLEGDELTIVRESLAQIPVHADPFPDDGDLSTFLLPTPLVESDHPKIVELADRLTSKRRTPLGKARAILAWLDVNIEKRPVLSIPDALATLENRVGDCNEHAVLLAALARAAGLPARIEAGLVHLKGRFYYHAWNQLFLGGWITVDAALKQFPADATHIRLIRGNPIDQLDLLGFMGNLKLSVVDVQYTSDR